MHKKLLFLCLLSLLLSSCSQNVPSSEHPSNEGVSSEQIESESSLESETSSNEESSVESSSEEITSEDSSSEEVSSESSSLEESSSEPTEEIPASGQTLPIGDGNKTVTGPANLKNPIDVSDWVEFDLFDSLPTYFSYIQGNNKVNSRGDFYAPSAGGGFKFSHLYYGLQTPVITSWKKLEIRLNISTVNNNSKKKDVDEPIFHVYGYDKTGRYISLDYIEQGKITAQTSEVKMYIRNENICYLEFRLNAFPYKGNQCYNFGVGSISIKGWEWE